jgi:hypothetical protein
MQLKEVREKFKDDHQVFGVESGRTEQHNQRASLIKLVCERTNLIGQN